MIVDTMTFDEIADYLMKTSFSKANIRAIYQEHIIPNEKKYRRAIIKWKQNPNHTEYKIFTPIISNGTCNEEWVFIPVAVNTNVPYHIIFNTFFYQGHRYVALSRVDSVVVFFSWHSLRRYSERFLKEPNPTIDNEFIGEMLIYNSSFYRTTYTYKGKLSKMYVSTDGGFLCDEYQRCIVVNTFISANEYFSNQEQLDRDAFEVLKKAKKESYGIWIRRA